MRYNVYNSDNILENVIEASEDFIKVYCNKHHCTYKLVEGSEELPPPKPLTIDEIEEMMLDNIYRITLLEMGVTEDDLQNS